MSLWLQWKNQFLSAPRPQFSQSLKLAQSLISNNITQQQAKKAEDFLNQMARATGFEEVSSKIVQGVAGVVNNLSVSDLSQANGKLQVKSITGNAAYSAYKAYTSGNASMETFRGNKQAKAYLQQLLDGNLTPEEVLAVAKSAWGHLSNIQGKILEVFLEYLNNTLQSTADDIAISNIENILENLKIDTENISISGLEDIKTQGDTQETVTVTIDDNEIKTFSAKNKTDVSINFPFLEGLQLTASAKNYSRFRDIKLLSGGNVVNLIAQSFPLTHSGGKWLYNALTIPDFTGIDNVLNAFHKIMLIKAMTGQHGGTEVMSNAIVMYFGDRVNPFRVVSTDALLTKLFTKNSSNNSSDFDKFVSFKYELKGKPTKPPIDEGRQDSGARTEETFAALNNLTVSVTLSKEAIKVAYLSSMLQT